MKSHKYLSHLIILIISISHANFLNAESKGKDFFQLYPKYETRAVWLTTLSGLDWPHSRSAETQKKELTEILDKLQDANINTVLFQTRIRGTVAYPSAMEPWDGCFTGTPGRSPDYDPLAFAIDECHKRGMEIQAWIVTIPVGRWNSLGCKTLRKKYPGMIMRKNNEGFIDPSNPLSATYITNICKEITNNYDIDGIHLDYIRYPENLSSKRADKETAKRNITKIVSTVSKEIKKIKPWVKLSCATIGKYSDLPRRASHGWNALNRVNQDAQAWMRAGYVDQLYPMIYFRGNNFYPFALDWKENSFESSVISGLGAYFLSPQEGNWPLEEITRQMNVSRSAGIGCAFFRAKFLLDDTKGLYTYTKEQFSPYPALIPPMHTTCAPDAPQSLNVTWNKGVMTATWSEVTDGICGKATYNVYASDTAPVDTHDARNLVAVRRKDNSLSIKSDRKLFIAVTAVNRFGNESKAVFDQSFTNSTFPNNEYSQTNTQSPAILYVNKPSRTISLPNKTNALDADFIMIKSLVGTISGVFPYKNGHADIGELQPGSYTVYSLNAKGVTHRLCFLTVKQ